MCARARERESLHMGAGHCSGPRVQQVGAKLPRQQAGRCAAPLLKRTSQSHLGSRVHQRPGRRRVDCGHARGLPAVVSWPQQTRRVQQHAATLEPARRRRGGAWGRWRYDSGAYVATLRRLGQSGRLPRICGVGVGGPTPTGGGHRPWTVHQNPLLPGLWPGLVNVLCASLMSKAAETCSRVQISNFRSASCEKLFF